MGPALQYHEETSYERHRMTGHYLDWANQPRVFKDYPGITSLLLPREVPLPEGRLSDLLRKEGSGEAGVNLGLEELSAILLMTCTITAKASHAEGEFFFRSAASAGALYPTEIYVALRGVEGLEPGLYHFAVRHHGLACLRKGDFTGCPPGAGKTAITFFLTAIFFRSAWKYRARSYRYHLLDTGHVVENLLLALGAVGLPFALSYDFDDAGVNQLIGLDETREAALAVVRIPGKENGAGTAEGPVEPLPEEFRNASRVCGEEKNYPQVMNMYRAGAQIQPGGSENLGMIRELGLTTRDPESLAGPAPWPEVMNHTEAVFRRRSKRNFIRTPLPSGRAAALLETLCAKYSGCGGREEVYRESTCAGFLADRVEGLEAGFHLLDISRKKTAMVRSGDYMEWMARVCLNQAWLKQTALHFLFMTNLDVLDRHLGPRGYRYAMMEAGRMGERLYVAATAMGLGCCGIGAFYDREAMELLGLNRASRLLYLVAVGPVKRL